MSKHRRYRKPPVVEVLCEMFFEGSQWDDTIIGQFYERVKNEFPQKPQQEIQEAQVLFSTSGEAAAGVRRLPPRMQFVSAGGDRMIQLGRDLLVVNQLRPYRHFEEWVENLCQALELYRELVAPARLARLGVRYINRVVVPAATVRMEDYFTVYPEIPEALGAAHGAFMLRVELPNRGGKHTLLLTFGSAPPEQPGTTTYLLDLYDVVEPQCEVSLETVRPIVQIGHDNVIEAFEASITEKLRATFEEEDS